MKKIISISIFILFTVLAFAQSPEKMNYQAVARDLSGLPLLSAAVSLQFEILEASASGLVVYRETQSKTTNQFGLFTAEIGAGPASLGTFSGIAWGTNAYYLRITVNGDVMPATQLLSVPYALYSKTSGVTGTALTAGPGIDITGGVVTATDTSTNNEIQVLTINATNDTIFLSNGGFVPLPVVVGDDWGTDTVSYVSNNITGDGTVANPLIVTDNDTSATNELQSLSWNTTDSNVIDLSDGTGISLASNTPVANQVLTWDGVKWIAQTLTTGVWTQGVGNDIYNNTDSVGISTTDPKSLLQIGDYTHFSPVEIGSTDIYSSLTHNAYWDGLTMRNTTGGISAISIMGEESGAPLYSWILYSTQTAGTDMMTITPSLRMSLRNKGLAINGDNPDAALDIGAQDSASILLQEPDDGSQATLIYRTGAGHIGIRVPSALSSGNYNLTYPTALPVVNGSSLVSDLVGNLSWGAPVTSPWTLSSNLIFPTSLSDKVGIGMNSPAAKLDVLSTTTENSAVTTQIVNQNNAATIFSSLYAEAQSSGASPEYAAAQFLSSGPGATGNSIGIRAGASGGANNWAAFFTSGNVHIQNNLGIGTITPSYPLEINRNQAGTGALLGITNPSGTGDATIHFSTGTGNFSMGRNGNTFKIAQASNLGSNVRMTIASTGNVGFGITAPTAKVHSEGFGGEALRVQNTSATVATMSVTNSVGGPAATFINGAVGIGALVPSARLQLNGTLRLQNLGGTGPVAGAVLTAIDANGNAQWQTAVSSALIWDDSSGDVELTTPANNVGVGLIPLYKLDVDGDVNTNTVYRIDGITFLDNRNTNTLVGATGNTSLSGAGANNIFIGPNAGSSMIGGFNNIAIGPNALQANTSSTENVAIGSNALTNSIVSRNVAVGDDAMSDNTTGIQSVAVGYQALMSNTTSNNNTAFGFQALLNTTGSATGNTAVGQNAGSANIVGSNNTFIGNNANFGLGLTNLANVTVIGSNATVTQANSVILGKNADVGIGTSAPLDKLQVNGNIGLGSGTAGNNQNKAIVVYLENEGTTAGVLGDIVIVGGSNGFVTTTTASSTSAIGVLTEACPVGGVCSVAIAGVTTVRGGGFIGQHCVTSNVQGIAGSTASPLNGASIGVFLTNSTGTFCQVLLR